MILVERLFQPRGRAARVSDFAKRTVTRGRYRESLFATLLRREPLYRRAGSLDNVFCFLGLNLHRARCFSANLDAVNRAFLDSRAANGDFVAYHYAYNTMSRTPPSQYVVKTTSSSILSLCALSNLSFPRGRRKMAKKRRRGCVKPKVRIHS